MEGPALAPGAGSGAVSAGVGTEGSAGFASGLGDAFALGEGPRKPPLKPCMSAWLAPGGSVPAAIRYEARTFTLGCCSRNIFKSFLSAPSLVMKDVRRLRKPHTSRRNISTSPFLCTRDALLKGQPQPIHAVKYWLTVIYFTVRWRVRHESAASTESVNANARRKQDRKPHSRPGAC